MEPLSIDEACLMRDNIRGELPPALRKVVKMWLFNAQPNSPMWGISVHHGEEMRETILSSVPEQHRDNIRFYDKHSHLLEADEPAA